MTPEEEAELIPWCLCRKRWYRVLFLNNPLLLNRFYFLGIFDPESWLEWWHLGAPVRVYYRGRDEWIDVVSGDRRTDKLYGDTIPIELSKPKRTIDDDDAGRSS